MLGPVVNALTVIVCSLLGCFLIRGLPERFEQTLKKGIGLAIIYIGIRGAMDNERPLLLIMSLVLGALLGELIDINKRMNSLGLWAEQKLYKTRSDQTAPVNTAANPGQGNKSFAKGFVSASILFCTGSMAIVGSMQSGLLGNHETLYAKSILDGSISIVFGASMGIGVLFSAIPVLLYQGSIVLLSMAVRDFLSPAIITEMSAVGNLLVAAIGFNFVCLPEDRAIKVANLIPAIFIPLCYLTLTAH
ncbi:membrane protein [Spirochaetia bacterium]|nr:membrane protein [Spirochaetia bacterium]